jgi:hypothetical protein
VVSGYASGTGVAVDRSKAEIERLLTRYGCSQFGSGWANEGGQAFAHVTFRHGSTSIMLALPMEHPSKFLISPAGRRRTKDSADEAYRAEERRRWRSLALVIKAKLEAVHSGISTLEREFFSDVVLPDGSTLGQRLIPQLEAIQNGRLMLPQSTP